MSLLRETEKAHKVEVVDRIHTVVRHRLAVQVDVDVLDFERRNDNSNS